MLPLTDNAEVLPGDLFIDPSVFDGGNGDTIILIVGRTRCQVGTQVGFTVTFVDRSALKERSAFSHFWGLKVEGDENLPPREEVAT